MKRGAVWYLAAPLIALVLAGCRFLDFEEREPWRAQAEEQCIAQGLVRPSAYVEPEAALNGRGTCGMTRPFKVAAVSGGFVALAPKATLACPLVANVEAWFMEAVQPAAMAWYGSPVVEVKQLSSYSCRTMNGQPGALISEHAFGNALDIASFRFADGREVNFKEGWKGKPEERGFLRTVHAAACERFSTVLAPGADMFHYDHIHVDLARRASGRSVCKPAPITPTPPPMRLPESVPVARAPSLPPAASASISRSTSPWAQPAMQQPAQAPAEGPSVIAREQSVRPVGPPLVLGNQAPSPGSFGTPLPLAERVRQALGSPTQSPVPAPVQQAPVPHPAQNPYGLLPPGRIPNARVGADPVITGSIKEAEKKPPVKIGTGAFEPALMSPQSLAEQAPRSEAVSVFDLMK